MDWISELFEELEDEKPSFGKMTYIDSLIRNSSLPEHKLTEIERELNEFLNNERADEIILELSENQLNMHGSGSYTATNISNYIGKL